MEPKIPIKFCGFNCLPAFSKYANGRTAIQLVEEGTGDPVAVATVNLPSVPLKEDEVFIKNWSENEGMTFALVKAGIIAPPHDTCLTGYCTADKCKLLIKP